MDSNISPTTTTTSSTARIGTGRRARRLRRATAALALTGAVAGVTFASAGSASATNGVRIYSASSFLNVAVADGSTAPGARIIQWTYTGGAEQQWTVPDSGRIGEIRNMRSGMCITTDSVPGHWLFQDRCDGRVSQRWMATKITALNMQTGYVSYKNPASGLVMDVQGYSQDRGANIDGWYPKGDGLDRFNQLFRPL